MGGELEAPEGARVIEVEGARVWVAGGVVHEVIDVARVELEHVLAIQGAVLELLGEAGRYPILVDVRAVRWASRDARARGGDEAVRFVAAAVALLVGSPVSRMVASIFVRMSNPRFPVRVFSSPQEALAWLAEYRSDRPAPMDRTR